MATVAGRFKDGDLIVKGEVDERLPFLTDGLVNFFPLDWNAQDRMTEYSNMKVITTDRDWLGSYFPSNYNYAGCVFMISGKVKCWDTIDPTKTTSIGLSYTKSNGAQNWITSKNFKMSDVQGNFVDFILFLTIPIDYKSGLRVWIQQDITAGSSGYKSEYRDIYYCMKNNPNIIQTNTKQIEDAMAITEGSTNYIVNGDFRNGLTNWVPSATATTLKLINTPWVKGVRVQRDAGDGGSWSLCYTGAKPSVYNAGETWVWSFKYRIIKAPTSSRPFLVGWWIHDNGAYRCNVNIVDAFDLDDGWKQAYATYTFIGGDTGPYNNTATMGFNSFASNCIVEFADVQLEKRNFPTPKIEGTTGDGSLQININLTNLEPNYSLIGDRRNIFETAFSKHLLIKSGTTFTYYKDMVTTTSFVNSWQGFKMKGLRYGMSATNDITKYTDPLSKFYRTDPLVYSYSLQADNAGYYFKTYVYCSQATSTWQRWAADNAGAMRINNGTIINLGGCYWEDQNPDILVSLNAGWNLVEMWYMDGDTGGGLSLQVNSQGKNSNHKTTPTDFVASVPFSQIPYVVYMTAELPIELSNNSIYYNAKSNVVTKNLGIYNKALTDMNLKSLYQSRIPIDINGILKTYVKEYPPFIPSDAIYFPLDDDANEFIGKYKPSNEINTVYEDGWVWVGPRTENLWATVAGRPAPWTNNGGLIRVNEEIPCAGSICWTLEKTGSGNQWHGYEGDYNNVCTGSQGDKFAGSAYVKTINAAGLTNVGGFILHSSDWSTVLGTESASANNMKICENDKWERVSATGTINVSCTTSKLDIFQFSYSTNKGLMYLCGIQWEKRPFVTPFVDGIREETHLEYNFNRDLGLNWSGNWSIVYFKKPVGTFNDTLTGYNLESLGCNNNSVGGGVLYWGKAHNSDAIYLSSGATFESSEYFNHPRMISLVKSGTTLTIKEWDYNGNVWTRNVTLSGISSNYYVSQYGYDFKLGGWDNGSASANYYRDLIVCPTRAFTDTELNLLFNDRYNFTDRTLQLQNKVEENPTLS